MTKKRYVLVGTGVRARNFITPLAERFRDQGELVGLCDLSPTRMAYYNEQLAGKLGYHAVPTYEGGRFEAMLQEQKPDVVIVTSKDSTHHDFIVRALRGGCDVITEKPMTIDAEKARLILDAVKETGRKVQVAFNYRWSAHRTKVRELIAAGTIGSVKSVNVEYLLNTNHGADYYRRWHATMADSGGLLVHKSTHHFDLVNWWIDAIPERVFAFGRLDFYGRKNAVARGDAELTKYDRYTGATDKKKDPFALDLNEDESLVGLYLKAEPDSGYLRDRNVFREDIDIYDNMSVLVRYRTGVQLNYSLVSFSPREGMRVTMDGDRGRLEYCEFQPTHIPGLDRNDPSRDPGDQGSETIRIYPMFKPSYEVAVEKLPGGHDGSDPVLSEQMFSLNPPADPFQRKAGHEQGAASILIGIAANRSIAENRPVDINELVPLKPGAKKLSELV
jgi:predicted dehydrogenase